QHYTRGNLVLGLAGGYPPSFAKKVEADFAKLPAGRAEKIKLTAPKVETGMRTELVKRDTRSTGISLGFPVDVTRADKAWPALYEYDEVVRDGMAQEAFETTRDFLLKNVNILTAPQNAQLGYALDSRYYGIPDFNTYMREQLSRLTLADVNNAIQRHLKSDRM